MADLALPVPALVEVDSRVAVAVEVDSTAEAVVVEDSTAEAEAVVVAEVVASSSDNAKK